MNPWFFACGSYLRPKKPRQGALLVRSISAWSECNPIVTSWPVCHAVTTLSVIVRLSTLSSNHSSSVRGHVFRTAVLRNFLAFRNADGFRMFSEFRKEISRLHASCLHVFHSVRIEPQFRLRILDPGVIFRERPHERLHVFDRLRRKRDVVCHTFTRLSKDIRTLTFRKFRACIS